MNVLSAEIVIAIGGKAGTLSELAYAWHYKKKIITCSYTGGWSEKILQNAIDNRDGAEMYDAVSLEEACDLIEKLLLD